jgi:anti-sigma factor RsiW
MNCTDFNKVFDDYVDQNVDGTLSQAQMAAAEAHLAGCADCKARVQAHQAMVAALRDMPVAGPSAGFEDRVLRTAVESNVGQHHRHGFLTGFGSAAVAALALWVVVGWFPGEIPGNSSETGIPELSIALSQQQDVKLAFHTVKALQGARITIQVPENVALVGYPGQRELSWETNLSEGENLLRLPVVASQAMQGQLVARIEHGKKVRTLRVNLKAGMAGLSGQHVLVEQLV